MLKKYLGRFFWVPILVKWYQNTSGFPVGNMCQTDRQLFILVLFEKAFIQLSNEGSYVSKQFFKEKLLAFL